MEKSGVKKFGKTETAPGFTLIELLVCIAVIGITSVVASKVYSYVKDKQSQTPESAALSSVSAPRSQLPVSAQLPVPESEAPEPVAEVSPPEVSAVEPEPELVLNPSVAPQSPLEIPLLDLLKDIEREGVSLDSENVLSLSARLKGDLQNPEFLAAKEELQTEGVTEEFILDLEEVLKQLQGSAAFP